MKKRLLLSVVLAALCSFIITGCGSSNDDGPAPLAYTPVNLESPDTLMGTYEIAYFLSSATIAATSTMEITSDCDYAKRSLGAVSCDPSANASMKGVAAITKNGDKYSVTSKIQLWGGIFDDPALGSMAAPSKYNYTAYAPVNADSIDAASKKINARTARTVVNGVESRNMNAMTSDSSASFSFEVDAGGNIVSTINLNSPVPALGISVPTVNKVVFRKVSNDPGRPLDPNTLVDSSISGFDAFDPNVYPTPVNLSDTKTLQGTYDVTFFGSGVENVRPDSLTQTAAYNYITNNSASAISAGLCTDNATQVNPGTLPFCNSSSQVTMIGGKLVITVDGGGLINIVSKMQMDGTILAFSPADKYQYTEYYPTASLTGTGVKGYNFDATAGAPSTALTENPLSPFAISVENGELRINLTLKDKSVFNGMITVDANTRVYAKKTSNKTDPLTNDLFQPFPAAP